MPPRPVRVVPLLTDLGTTAGHRLVLLSLEIYDDWADLRYARIDEEGTRPLPRRVPPPDAWRIIGPGGPCTVIDAVGRGDRAFSNGEVRFSPPPTPGQTLDIAVRLLDGAEALTGTVAIGT